MVFWVYPGGHDLQHRINLDSLGQLYLAFATTWTSLLLCGMTFLVRNRKLPFLRIRRLPLGILAVCTLHVYWCLCMLAYILNGYFPCSTEYWIMSTYLPVGIALYQANNTQLLHVAGFQQDLANPKAFPAQHQRTAPARGWRSLVVRWKSYSATKRATTCIKIGIIAQLLCTLFIFLISRRFHSSWGIVGSKVDAAECRRGWEWWPSIAWQFSWSWLYAPYILWKIRNVKDVHGWRLQTVLCSFAGLPGSPMWLIALYVSALAGIDRYWVPPLWFSPGILVMEASVIFIPCWQILKSRRLRRETLEIIAEWEAKRKNGSSTQSSSIQTACESNIQKSPPSTSTEGSRRGEMYTMHTLEKALQTNSTPLLLFAALRDFSGENISFLNHVREWKANWDPPSDRLNALRRPHQKRLSGETLRRDQFNKAVQIYASFVGVQYSEFPINLSFVHRKELEVLFDNAADLITAHVKANSATPFDDVEHGLELDGASVASTGLNKSSDSILPGPAPSKTGSRRSIDNADHGTRLPADVTIPDNFGPHVFDNAEESIKYMVLTNTWPKFVSAGYASTVERTTFLVKLKEGVMAWIRQAEGR